MGQGAVHILKAGTMLHDRYVIERLLGEGGFGITYKGADKVLAAEIAVKEYFPQGLVTRNNLYSEELTVTQMKYGDIFQKGKERFLKEARTLARFNKEDGIVRVTDFFEENNTVYIVMEYLDGIDLGKYLKENGSLTVEETLGMMAPIIETLDAVHSSGLIHRDISPDNIMLLVNGGVKLMDFGAARDYTEFGQKSLSIVLKHGYAPEEQYRTHGEQGPWTDIYALCATMYKCITGQTPVEALERMQNDTLRSPAQLGFVIPPQVNYAIMKGIAVRRQDRYQNLKDFCEDLYGDGRGIVYNDYSGNRPDQTPTVEMDKWRTDRPVSPNSEFGEDAKDVHENTESPGSVPNYMTKIIAGIAVVFIIGIVFLCGVIKQNSPSEDTVTESSAEPVSETETTAAGSVDSSTEKGETSDISQTYVTGKSINYNSIPVYSEPGKGEPIYEVPEAVCVHVTQTTLYQGTDWYKIEYCGIDGWMDSQYLRWVSEKNKYFYIKDDPSENIVFVNEEKIKLHSDAKKKSSVVAVGVLYGTEFEITELKNGWGKTTYNGSECWIDMKVVNAYLTKYWQVEVCNGSADDINLRSFASEEAESLKKIPVGKVLKIKEFSCGWGKVTYKGKTGWVKLHYATPCSKNGLARSEDTK